MKSTNTNLPEHEMLFDYTFDCRITPNITIQNLASKFFGVLNIYHQPLIQTLTFEFSLCRKDC